MRAWSLLACAAVAACAHGSGERPSQPARGVGWRAAATQQDRARLRGWRTAWIGAIEQARARGAGAEIAAQGALLDPDRAVAGPAIPEGAYRCRTLKLGNRSGGDGFVAYPWFACRVDGATLRKTGGTQRGMGTLYPDTDARGIFLGTLVLGDEARPMAYGRDAARDMAGVVERIGPRRWRIAFPYPRFESTLDVLELVPG